MPWYKIRENRFRPFEGGYYACSFDFKIDGLGIIAQFVVTMYGDWWIYEGKDFIINEDIGVPFFDY